MDGEQLGAGGWKPGREVPAGALEVLGPQGCVCTGGQLAALGRMMCFSLPGVGRWAAWVSLWSGRSWRGAWEALCGCFVWGGDRTVGAGRSPGLLQPSPGWRADAG